MAKVIATILMFRSFGDVSGALAKHRQEVYTPPEPMPGIHVVTIYDDSSSSSVPQHAIVVVVGDVGSKWHQHSSSGGISPVGGEIISVDFEEGTIPMFINGEMVAEREINIGSLHGPRSKWIHFEE